MCCVFCNSGEAENKEVRCDEANDQSERSQNVSWGLFCSLLWSQHHHRLIKSLVCFCRKEKDRAKAKEKKKKDPSELKEREVQKYPSCLFFQYNTQLGPPYHVLVDTNFINFSIKAKLDIVQSMMDCLYAKCIPYITDCVMAEIEKLGMKYRVALRIAKDARFERLPCTHKGTYADDCLVQRVTQHKCYILATVDRDLKRRVRKIPGVPIMYISNHRYNIERMPDDYGAPRF
uniref:rRNA-processing protein FCF1 homolog n=1 Tax=Scophthalmus maximus TaxID=52904 RepID=A0A8D3BMB3_SCOMX